MLALGLHVRPLRLEELEQRPGALAERYLGRVPRLAGLAEEGLLEAPGALAGDRVARHRRAHLLRDGEAELLDLAARDQRLGLGALMLGLVEVEDGERNGDARAVLIGEVARHLELAVRVLHAERRVRPALGAREAERRLGRLPGTLGRREIGPARERLAHQLLGARGRRRERELAHRLDVRRVHADQREQSGHRLAAVAFRVRHLALDAALLEGGLVELGARNVTLPRPRPAPAPGLPVALA